MIFLIEMICEKKITVQTNKQIQIISIKPIKKITVQTKNSNLMLPQRPLAAAPCYAGRCFGKENLAMPFANSEIPILYY